MNVKVDVKNPIHNPPKGKCRKCQNKEFFGDRDTGKWYCDVCGTEKL